MWSLSTNRRVPTKRGLNLSSVFGVSNLVEIYSKMLMLMLRVRSGGKMNLDQNPLSIGFLGQTRIKHGTWYTVYSLI